MKTPCKDVPWVPATIRGPSSLLRGRERLKTASEHPSMGGMAGTELKFSQIPRDLGRGDARLGSDFQAGAL